MLGMFGKDRLQFGRAETLKLNHPVGWECLKCHNIWAPNVRECSKCNNPLFFNTPTPPQKLNFCYQDESCHYQRMGSQDSRCDNGCQYFSTQSIKV